MFESLLQKRSGIRSLADRTDGHATPGAVADPPGLWIGGPIVDFEPKQYVRPRKALKVMCREIQLAFAASQLAVDDAGLSEWLPAQPDGQLKPQDIGTVFGSEMFYGLPTELESAVVPCFREDGTIDQTVFGQTAMKNIMPLWMLKYLPNMPACHVGIALNAHGPNNTLVLGDASAGGALIESASCLERGIAKVMVAGACGTRINTTRMNYYNDLPPAEVFDPIQQSARPHDPHSVGVVGGEGAASIILESEDHASQRGARPLARIVSYASRFVSCSQMSKPRRSAKNTDSTARTSQAAIELAIRDAIKDAGIVPSQLGVAMIHGMGDPVTDAAERAALQATIPKSVPTVATIAAIGHTGAACGAIDVAVAALSLSHGTVPPTLQTDTTCRDVGLIDQSQPIAGDYALVLTHTTEGSAMALVLRKPS